MDANQIIEAITERVKDTANVRVVFGDTVETTGGVAIIPVATVKVSGGGGGGSGRGRAPNTETTDSDQTGSGLGLGLNIQARPLGYIEVKADAARFVPIVDTTKIAVGGMLVAAMFLLTVSRVLTFKAWSKRRKMMRQHAHSHASV